MSSFGAFLAASVGFGLLGGRLGDKGGRDAGVCQRLCSLGGVLRHDGRGLSGDGVLRHKRRETRVFEVA